MGALNNAPKPDAERRRRNAPTFAWTILPAAGRSQMPPELPHPPAWLETLAGGWPMRTVLAWTELWSKPQATVWDQSGSTLHGWAELHALGTVTPLPSAARAEMRQIEDRHGLSPRALLALRWRIEEVPAERAALAVVTSIDRPAAGKKPVRAKKDPRVSNGRTGRGAKGKDPRV